jgi:hypothetical protein
MKRLNKFVAGLGLVAVLAAGSSSVFAKSEAPKPRVISGHIVSIDRGARTMIVRDINTNSEVLVRVPKGVQVKTNTFSGAPVAFELLLEGINVRDLTVE